ncbi:MAG TPA: hypothetical protein VMZ28_16660 [Kofleriaceae bacterium]|nr:hypothetical protein [Kofleriaceae bacterium]
MRTALVLAAALIVAPSAAAADATTAAVMAELPSDVTMVASIDVARARKASAFRKLPEKLRRSADALGIGRVWLAVPASAVDGQKRMAMMATTTIDEARLVAHLERTRGKTEARRAHERTYHLVDGDGWALVDGMLLVASADYIERVLERDGAAATDDPSLAAAVAAAERSGGHAWMALVLPETLRGQLRSNTMAAPFADMRWLAAHATLGRGARYGVELRAAKDSDATAIATLLTSTVQMMGTSESALKTMTFRADGSSVHSSGAITAAQLDSFAKTFSL